MAINIKKAKVGDKFKTRTGEIVSVICNDGTDIPIQVDTTYWYYPNGVCADSIGEFNDFDILSRVGRGGARKGSGRKPKAVVFSNPAKPVDSQPLTWTTVAKQLAAKYPDAALWVLSEKVE